MDFRGPGFGDELRRLPSRRWPKRKLYSIPVGCYHRFIDSSVIGSSDLAAGLLVGWLAWLGWMAADVGDGEDDEEEGFQGCLTGSSLEELGAFR